ARTNFRCERAATRDPLPPGGEPLPRPLEAPRKPATLARPPARRFLIAAIPFVSAGTCALPRGAPSPSGERHAGAHAEDRRRESGFRRRTQRFARGGASSAFG